MTRTKNRINNTITFQFRKMRLLILILEIPLLLGVGKCSRTETITSWIKTTNQLRIQAESLGSTIPYKKEQYLALKAYFQEMNRIAVKLTEKKSLAKKFSSMLSKGDINQFCDKLFVKSPEWKQMMHNCMRGPYFLCSDEVRSYPDTVQALRNLLSPELQKALDNAPHCEVLSKPT